MQKVYSFLLLLSLFGCSDLEPIGDYNVYENFLAIVSDLQRHLDEDLYQFPLAKDPSGQNIFKATLIRLDNYQRLYPEKFSEIVAFSRGQCHEKLGNFQEALFFFKQTLRYEGRLAPLAKKEIEFVEIIINVFKIPVPNNNLPEILKQFDRRDELFKKLLHNYQGSEVFLIQREIERNQISKITFAKQNRFHMDNGIKFVLELYNKLLQEHKNSDRVYQHLLSFADFYFLLAKEYVLYRPPETFAFNKDEFSRLTQPAVDLYRLVSNVDGRLEKIEAQGKLVAITAFIENILNTSN